ncbi:MAG: hypothetical protein DHS20C09_07530 [marine bacterium B5-7]|nr:MAG: hypothetical protein DHS20C09_07530 [marine bacterium B5-7]
MSNETKSNTTENENNQPDYTAKQYRVIRVEDGWKSRAETIGAVWKTEKGLMFRPSGKQIIENDMYFFPIEKNPSVCPVLKYVDGFNEAGYPRYPAFLCS